MALGWGEPARVLSAEFSHKRIFCILFFFSIFFVVSLEARKCFIPERLRDVPVVSSASVNIFTLLESNLIELITVFTRRGWANFVAFTLWRYPMFSKLMDAMFGCRHARYTFPITVRAGSRRTPTAQRTGTYVACLDCGREFSYDWRQMKIMGPPAKEVAHRLVTKEAA